MKQWTTTEGGIALSEAPPYSLRDLFALAAMHAIINSPAMQELAWQELAVVAYRTADAMLAEREKETK